MTKPIEQQFREQELAAKNTGNYFRWRYRLAAHLSGEYRQRDLFHVERKRWPTPGRVN